MVTEGDDCLHDFFVVLAICNTVVVSKRTKKKEADLESVDAATYNTKDLSEAVLSEIEKLLGHTNINDIEYEAESPDEQALVEVTHTIIEYKTPNL